MVGSRRGGGNSLQDDAETSADLAKRSGAGRANAFAMVSALTRVWAPAIVIGKPWLRKTNSDYLAMLLAYLPDPFSCSGEAIASRSAVGTRSPSAAGVGNVCVNSAGTGMIPDACLDEPAYLSSSSASGTGNEPFGFGSICSMSSQPLASSQPYRKAFNSSTEANS